jgi:hypothetical protein
MDGIYTVRVDRLRRVVKIGYRAPFKLRGKKGGFQALAVTTPTTARPLGRISSNLGHGGHLIPLIVLTVTVARWSIILKMTLDTQIQPL